MRKSEEKLTEKIQKIFANAFVSGCRTKHAAGTPRRTSPQKREGYGPRAHGEALGEAEHRRLKAGLSPGSEGTVSDAVSKRPSGLGRDPIREYPENFRHTPLMPREVLRNGTQI